MNRYLIIDRKDKVLYHVQNIIIKDERQTSSIACTNLENLYCELLEIIRDEIDILDLNIKLNFEKTEE